MLAGQVAVITGAAQGIGLATAKLLLKSGAKVCVLDVSDRLQRACSDLRELYRREDVLCVQCDVTDQRKMREAFQNTVDHYGSLDIVVNNAGILNEENWQLTLKINLEAVISGTHLAREFFSGSKGGTVVNISSIAGLHPLHMFPVYSATKHGVVGFTRSLKHWTDECNIRVNCICPYIADTEIGQKGFEHLTPEMLKIGMVIMDTITEGILQLITDTSKAGAVLRATPRGLTYQQYPEDRVAKL